MDRLLREGNPPTGQLASPKPQYKDVQTNSWEELKGEGGASYVKDKAVLAKLTDLESELAELKGGRVTQTVIAREVRQAGVTPRVAATPPTGTLGALIEHRIWGMTGTFAQDQGARLEIGLMKTYGVATAGPWYLRRTGWTRVPSANAQQVILLCPGVTLSDADNEAPERVGGLYLPVRPLVPIRLRIEIAGTFNAGEGVDSEVVVTWFVGVLA